MTDIAAGFWPCKVIDGFFGDVEVKPGRFLPFVRITVEVTEGSHKGGRFTYEEEVNNKQAPYIARTAKAVGWKCRTLETLAGDIASWVNETGGESTLEIKHIEFEDRKTGKPRVWVKPNSIGRGPKPVRQASRENLDDANNALLSALAGELPEDSRDGDQPMTARYDSGGAPDDIPPAGDDDIPFCSLSMTAAADRAVIAKVIR